MRFASLLSLSFVLCAAAHAAPTFSTSLNPMSAYSSASSIILEPSNSPSTVLSIQATGPVSDASSTYVNFPMNIWSGGPIDTIGRITFCYQVSDSGTFISQTRLRRTTTPDVATIMYDNGTNFGSQSPHCSWVDVNQSIPSGEAVTLGFRVALQDASSWIDIGSITFETL